MVLIPAGSFEMGNRQKKEDEGPVHRVSMDSFLMDKYEVTQAEYERHSLPNPSHFKGPTLPVEQITKVEFIINLKAAKALGLQVPLHLLQFAEEVIE